MGQFATITSLNDKMARIYSDRIYNLSELSARKRHDRTVEIEILARFLARKATRKVCRFDIRDIRY